MVDYVVIAISPVLVATMIGSLAFFLAAVLQPSPYTMRFNFVIAMYTMGTVAISRISIEEGKEKAVLYGIPLAIVSFIALNVFAYYEGPLPLMGTFVHALLITITWWSAHKLTWDCTVIFDHEDSSGQGLLQKVGLDDHDTQISKNNGEQQDDPEADSWFERWKANRKKPHTPGVWLIYYSLAALPLFGLGNAFVVEAKRSFCFQMGFIYVASALGLLMTTSFLGLRRYLRHRKIEMPDNMAKAWLSVGTGLIVVLMVAALILPRPDNGPEWKDLSKLFGDKEYETSDNAIGSDGHQSGESPKPIGPTNGC